MAYHTRTSIAETQQWIRNAVHRIAPHRSPDDLDQDFFDETRPVDFKEPTPPDECPKKKAEDVIETSLGKSSLAKTMPLEEKEEGGKDHENDTPINRAIECIEFQKNKENKKYIWEESVLKDIEKLQKNNVGCMGETYLQRLCEMSSVPSEIDGVVTKQVGGGVGDGFIKSPENTVEIKTAYQGAGNANNFQHELAEFAWKAKYMCFIDICANDCIYITLFKNWTEEFYKKSGLDNSCKCVPYFPTRSICWRKKEGNYKLDTTIKINENNVKEGYTLKITENTTFMDVKEYIDKTII
tara:strand:- start:89 stop:979 length:891 start_codon:yes stop_codon:yes gene_type:complete